MSTPAPPQVLLLLLASEKPTPGTFDAAVARLDEFRESGMSWPLRVATGDAADAETLITEHKSPVVHIKALSGQVALPPGLAEALKRSNVRCVILENCFSIEAADRLSLSVEAVIGINGPFADLLLSTVYARLDVDGPHFEIFRAAHWSFFNHYSETRDAAPEHRPYYITRDTAAFAAGHANLESQSMGGAGFAGGLFQSKDPEEEKVRCLLHFATNRALNDANDLTKGFSGDRGDAVRLGTCSVLVPRFHDIGTLERQRWYEKLMGQPGDKFEVEWSSLAALAEDPYWASLRKVAAGVKVGRGSSLVYLHGYNVSFEMAALRAAQLALDLKVQGAMNFFSWPSRGKFSTYTVDETSIEASELEITEYLQRQLQEVGSGRVHVLAHSMGNRGLLRALQSMLARAQKKAKASFGQIILCAPDVDEKVFRDFAEGYRRLSKRTTLYVSSRDLALASSGIVHGNARAGYTPPITIVEGIDTIQAADVDLSLLGHGYYADAREVLEDMFAVLRNGPTPDERFGPKRREQHGSTYWEIVGS